MMEFGYPLERERILHGYRNGTIGRFRIVTDKYK